MNESQFRRALVREVNNDAQAHAWAVEPGNGGDAGVPDIAVAVAGRIDLIECKVLARAGATLRLRQSQENFMWSVIDKAGVHPYLAILSPGGTAILRRVRIRRFPERMDLEMGPCALIWEGPSPAPGLLSALFRLHHGMITELAPGVLASRIIRRASDE